MEDQEELQETLKTIKECLVVVTAGIFLLDFLLIIVIAVIEH